VAQWNLRQPGWSALGGGLGCVTAECTGAYANAVDAAPGALSVTGNFGTAGAVGSDNFARWVLKS
jgi:hypothetical protein